FVDAFADWGVRAEQVQASYAMAENVFAVTQTALGRTSPTVQRSAVRQPPVHAPFSFDLVDPVYMSSGCPIGGMALRIVHAGRLCRNHECGDIQLRTESLFSGYWGAEGFNNSAFTADGWYSTGDYGFVVEDELFVIGRTKDIVIVGGQNVFP